MQKLIKIIDLSNCELGSSQYDSVIDAIELAVEELEIQKLEEEGLTRSDAQGVVMAKELAE